MKLPACSAMCLLTLAIAKGVITKLAINPADSEEEVRAKAARHEALEQLRSLAMDSREDYLSGCYKDEYLAEQLENYAEPENGRARLRMRARLRLKPRRDRDLKEGLSERAATRRHNGRVRSVEHLCELLNYIDTRPRRVQIRKEASGPKTKKLPPASKKRHNDKRTENRGEHKDALRLLVGLPQRDATAVRTNLTLDDCLLTLARLRSVRLIDSILKMCHESAPLPRTEAEEHMLKGLKCVRHMRAWIEQPEKERCGEAELLLQLRGMAPPNVPEMP